MSDVFRIEVLEMTKEISPYLPKSRLREANKWVPYTDLETGKPAKNYRRASAAMDFVDNLITERCDYACFRIVCSDGSHLLPWDDNLDGSLGRGWLHIVL